MYYYATLQGIFYFANAFIGALIFLKSYNSSIYYKSLALKYLSIAIFFMALDFANEGSALYFFQGNSFIIAISLTVLGPIFLHSLASALASVIIVTFKPKFNPNAGIIFVAIGFFAAALNFIHNEGIATFTPDGFVNPNFNPLAEFITFFDVLIIVIALAATFLTQMKRKRISKRALFIAAGTVLTAIGGPIIYSVKTYELFMFFNIITTIGMVVMAIGVYMPPDNVEGSVDKTESNKDKVPILNNL